jgi:hypothetical protein
MHVEEPYCKDNGARLHVVHYLATTRKLLHMRLEMVSRSFRTTFFWCACRSGLECVQVRASRSGLRHMRVSAAHTTRAL